MQSPHELLGMTARRLEFVAEYSGGQGRTLHVRDDANRSLVLKVLPAGERPIEAGVVGSIRHPCIPAVLEVGRLPDGRVFVLREHVDGDVMESLPRSPEALRPILHQVLELIAFVHQRGVLHLDLKPANLLLDRDGRVHLLDFGLAVHTGAASSGGTPFFASPEVLLGALPDRRADLFSIGAMVVHALVPPQRLSLDRFVRTFPNVDFFAACGVARDELPEPLRGFVASCVARQPERRFPDADTALEALSGSGTGRASRASLRPDPVQVFAQELAPLANGGDPGGDVVVRGASAADRRAIALHLCVSIGDVAAIDERADELRLRRDGAPGLTVLLPPLDDERVAAHLQQLFGLDEVGARRAVPFAVRRGRATDDIARALAELVDAGELLPAGTRWTWPGARSGRLPDDGSEDAGVDARGAAAAPLADRVRRAAALGRFEQACALWNAADPEHERDVRTALVEGLLDGGEPSRALPFTADLPVLRAQALVETGQYALAARELARLGAPRDGRHLRAAALLASRTGNEARARELLAASQRELADRLALAALLEDCGELDACERILTACLDEVEPDEQPYACASLHTTFGLLLRQRGDLDGARRHFEQAESHAQRLGHLRHAASSQLNLGVIAKDKGEHGEAVVRFREAQTLYEHVGDRVRAATAEANLGIAAMARGDLPVATRVLAAAAERLEQLGDVATARIAAVMLARAHARGGDVEAAERALRQVGEPDTPRLRDEVGAVRRELQERTPIGQHAEMREHVDDAGPSRELFRTFLSVNRKLAQATALDDAMAALLDAAVTLTGGRHGYLLVMREDGMRKEFQGGGAGTHAQAFSRSLAHRAIQEQRTLTGADALGDVELQQLQSVRNLRVRSAICAPFQSASGTSGAIYVEHPGRAGVFSSRDEEALEVLADQAAIAVDRMLREEAVRRELSQSKQQLLVANRSLRRAPTKLIGGSRVMQELRAEIDKLANVELPVLVLGETGTGKELVARALHERGARSAGPFVAENCSALPSELMERELFGHVEGAFTGADRDRPGLLELASGGTLFLDEVGDMSAALQAKLLRALQEQAIRRVGGSETIALDLRLVAATHKDLRAMVQHGAFREDLYFRLAAVELRVPPLRERADDIAELTEHFVRRVAEQRGAALRIGKPALAALQAYRWPGNVRELEHVIARAALLCEGDVITDVALPAGGGAADAPVADASSSAGGAAADEVVPLKEAERRAIAVALTACRGDKTKAARALGISRTALYDKIKRHGLDD